MPTGSPVAGRTARGCQRLACAVQPVRPVRTVQDCLAQSGLEPGRLELEITESLIIEDLDRAIDTLRQLKAMGVRVAMDDFGTGYSSLATLQAFPFDNLKIDRSVTCNLDTNEEAATILRAVIGLAVNLKDSRVGRGRGERGPARLPANGGLRRGPGLRHRNRSQLRTLPALFCARPPVAPPGQR